MKNGELYFKDSTGEYHHLGTVADFISIDEITSDITDATEPAVEDEEFIKKFKRNQDFSISFNISNVNKDVLIKEFIEPYLQYEHQRKLFNLYLKNYRYEQMKSKAMMDRDIVTEEVYKKHKWGFL